MRSVKATVFFISILFLITLESRAQDERLDNLTFNLPPLLGSTIELGWERSIRPRWSFDVSAGYVFNSPLSSPFAIGTTIELTRKSGMFLKIGGRYNLRSSYKTFGPFIGMNVVNAYAIEEGVYTPFPTFPQDSISTPVSQNSYNLGLGFVLGVVSPSYGRFSFDAGLQIGAMLVDHLLSYHSYMPGQGVDLGGIRLQGILRVKYAL